MSGRLPGFSADWLEKLIAAQRLCVSVITRIELLTKIEPAEEYASMRDFVQAVEVLPLNEPIVWQTILLRQQQKVRKTPDAIIAATALEHGLPLITRNVADFLKADGVLLLNPHNNLEHELIIHGLIELQ